MFNRKPFGQVQKKDNPKQDKCEIIIKHSKDGTTRKIIRGSCNKQQLEALSQSHLESDISEINS